MNKCEQIQQQINTLGLGHDQVELKLEELSDLESHLDACKLCSRHAVSLLVISASTRANPVAPPADWDASVLSAIAGTPRRTTASWLRAAALIVGMATAFALGHSWKSDDTLQVSPLVDEGTGLEAERSLEPLPSVSLEQHDYNHGFLAGRTFTVQENN